MDGKKIKKLVIALILVILAGLEEQLGVEIKIVSVGPDREQTIERYTEE